MKIEKFTLCHILPEKNDKRNKVEDDDEIYKIIYGLFTKYDQSSIFTMGKSDKSAKMQKYVRNAHIISYISPIK